MGRSVSTRQPIRAFIVIVVERWGYAACEALLSAPAAVAGGDGGDGALVSPAPVGLPLFHRTLAR